MMRYDEVCSSAIFVDHRFSICTLETKGRLRTEQKSKISYPNSNQKREAFMMCVYVRYVHNACTHKTHSQWCVYFSPPKLGLSKCVRYLNPTFLNMCIWATIIFSHFLKKMLDSDLISVSPFLRPRREFLVYPIYPFCFSQRSIKLDCKGILQVFCFCQDKLSGIWNSRYKL